DGTVGALFARRGRGAVGFRRRFGLGSPPEVCPPSEGTASDLVGARGTSIPRFVRYASTLGWSRSTDFPTHACRSEPLQAFVITARLTPAIRASSARLTSRLLTVHTRVFTGLTPRHSEIRAM